MDFYESLQEFNWTDQFEVFWQLVDIFITLRKVEEEGKKRKSRFIYVIKL